MLADTLPETKNFIDLGLCSAITDKLTTQGFTAPTPIQAAAIPALLAGSDVLGQAATGTGKTAAFGLPIVQRLTQEGIRNNQDTCAALILVPTRELAIQVGTALKTFATAGLRVVPVYGGQPIGAQLRALRHGVDVLVATPGRLLDHVERKSIYLGDVRTVVLDEADEMLDMGFAQDLDAILGLLPEQRQTALFSATLPRRVADIAQSHLTDPVHVKVSATATTSGPKPQIKQVAYVVQARHKAAALARVLTMEDPPSSIVFCRTRADVDQLTATLMQNGQRCEALHGGLSQEQRDRVMARYRNGQVNLLIATDVAARGLDIDHVSHVFNYDLPGQAEVYVHRIGRTGRAGREGVAISFVKPNERRFLLQVERKTQAPIRLCPLPTVEALQARRLEQTKAKLRATLALPEAQAWREQAQALLAEFDGADLASIALQLAHATLPTCDSHTEIAAVTEGSRGPRERQRRDAPAQQARTRPQRGSWPTTRLFLNTGRDAGIRPGDLVGAIANELDLDSRAIGSIEIGPRFSLVEVPEEIADDIIAGMRGATIRGKRISIRRDYDAA